MTPPHILSATAVIQITNVGNKLNDYSWRSARVVYSPVTFLYVCACHISACKFMGAYFNFTGLIG